MAFTEKIGKVFSINISKTKGVPKTPVDKAFLREGFGLEGDAHAGSKERQVSLLSIEDIEKAEDEASSCDIDFHPGIFAENITTEYLDLTGIKAGDKFFIGDSIILTVTQIGKDCHSGCSISKETGRCIMPKLGIFAKVDKGGQIKVRDKIRLLTDKPTFFEKFRISK